MQVRDLWDLRAEKRDGAMHHYIAAPQSFIKEDTGRTGISLTGMFRRQCDDDTQTGN